VNPNVVMVGADSDSGQILWTNLDHSTHRWPTLTKDHASYAVMTAM
jgi:hypothetical protein